MIQFTINPPPNLYELASKLGKIPGGMERAGRSAIRRTLRGGKQDAARKIAARYTSPVALVTKTIRLNVGGLTGEMTSRGSRNPMERFRINPRKRQNPPPPGGVHAEILRGGGGQLRRAFLMQSGGVFERVGRERFPIRKFHSPSAPGMMAVAPVSDFILEKMEHRLGINLEHEMAAVIGGFLS